MEILENREKWLATFRAGWLAHFEQTGDFDWKLYNRPTNTQPVAGPGVDPAASRLLLISSAGAYLPGQQPPFDAPNPLGDYSVRLIPSSTPLDGLAFSHTHYDHAAVDADRQVLVPLRHLEDMAHEGSIGEIAEQFVSFMGYQPDAARVVDETIPLIREAARDLHAQAALLVPA